MQGKKYTRMGLDLLSVVHDGVEVIRQVLSVSLFHLEVASFPFFKSGIIHYTLISAEHGVGLF